MTLSLITTSKVIKNADFDVLPIFIFCQVPRKYNLYLIPPIYQAKELNSYVDGIQRKLYPSDFKIRVSAPLSDFNSRRTDAGMSVPFQISGTPKWNRSETPLGGFKNALCGVK
jgi:hypothetical protein